MSSGSLVDRFGRVHTKLRVSVTDRCNIRCFYCMPPEGVQFRPHAEILTYEEIVELVGVAAELGIRQVRLTGGEPLVRLGVVELVRMLRAVPGIEGVALTTNGILLPRYAEPLRAAGLARLNISLDALDRAHFQQIARRDELDGVLAGIEAALAAGFTGIKLNAVALRGITESEAVPLARFALARGLELRFIEYMPVSPAEGWKPEDALTGREILAILARELGPLVPDEENDPRSPATLHRFTDRPGRIGLISSVSEPFCGQCNRLRLTAEGQIKNCLFGTQWWDAKAILRGGGGREALAQLLQDAVAAKPEAHGTESGAFARAGQFMHQIGG